MTAKAACRLNAACTLLMVGLMLAAAASEAGQVKSSVKAAANTVDPGYLVGYDQRADVKSFMEEMATKNGFVLSELQAMFARSRYNPTVAKLMNPSTATHPKNWQDYEQRLVESKRIDAGVRFWRAHADDLERASRAYGVPQEIIVGILGIETIYGQNMGKFRVIDALVTLSFDYPNKEVDRSAFFREQLEDYLLFSRDRSLDVFALRGSYAGAIGMPQFMPESYQKYAVDFDGDGVIDLVTDPSDAIGSVANFLSEHGWKRGQPIFYPASLAPGADMLAIDALVARGSDPSIGSDALKGAGVVLSNAVVADAAYALIDLPNGDAPTQYVVGAQNFHVLTRYNRSYFYVMAVVELGQAIKARVAQ